MLRIPNIHRLYRGRDVRGLLSFFRMTVFLSFLVAAAFYVITPSVMNYADESTPLTNENARHLTANVSPPQNPVAKLAPGKVVFSNASTQFNATIAFGTPPTATIIVNFPNRPDAIIKIIPDKSSINVGTVITREVSFKVMDSKNGSSGVFTFDTRDQFYSFIRRYGGSLKGRVWQRDVTLDFALGGKTATFYAKLNLTNPTRRYTVTFPLDTPFNSGMINVQLEGPIKEGKSNKGVFFAQSVLR